MPSPRQRLRIATRLRELSGLVAFLLPLIALAVPAAPAAAQQTRFTRPIEVPQAGWVEVPLETEILRRAAPAGGHLRLFGPEGEEVAFARTASEGDRGRMPAEVLSAQRRGGGWTLVLQVTGSEGVPVRHDRLFLGLEGSPSGVRSWGPVHLEGGDDGERWSLLAVGHLEAGADGDVLLTYPATEHRYLRLHLPEEAVGSAQILEGGDQGEEGPAGEGAAAPGPPLRGAAVELVPRRALGITLERPACQSPVAAVVPVGVSADGAQAAETGDQAGPSIGAPAGASGGFGAGPRTICPLPLGVEHRLLRRLDLVVAAERPVGYRLLVPDGGRWEVVAEGVWNGSVPEAPHALGLDLLGYATGRGLPLPAAPEPLRLELYGTGSETPSLERVGAEVRAQSLLFEARRAGRHTLAYGPGIYRSSRSADVGPPRGVEPVRIEPGAEEPGAGVASEAALPAAGDPAPSVRFARRWQVTAEAPEPGALLRLEVVPEVYGASRGDLGDLRLLADAAQVPFLRWRPAAPSLAAALGGLVPEAELRTAGASGRLRLGIDLEHATLPYSALVVHAPAERFRGRVRLLAVDPSPVNVGGDEGRPRPLTPWLDWECDPRPPLSCRRLVELEAEPLEEEAPRRLVLEVEPRSGTDAGSRAPATLDVELFRSRDVLLFPWPGEGQEVELVAGAEDLGAPDYGLEDRLAELLARPSRRAELGAEGAESERDRRVGDWTMVITLLVGLGGLLWLLNGILAARDPV